MPENDNDSGLFGGSVDRSRLEEMKAAAGDDPERQARVAEVQAQVDAVAESDAAAEDARQQQASAGVYTTDEVREQEARELEPEESAAPIEPEAAPAEDLSALSKAELRDRVVAQRVQYGHDETQARADVEAENKTKAELTAELGG
jgi:hypothetical protein